MKGNTICLEVASQGPFVTGFLELAVEAVVELRSVFEVDVPEGT